MGKINDLKQFYSFMLGTRQVKKTIFDLYIQGRKEDIIRQGFADKLKDIVLCLESIGKQQGKYVLTVTGNKTMQIDLSYELDELKKDIYFLGHTEEEFAGYLNDLHPGLEQRAQEILNAAAKVRFRNFISDRDGTVNNYCARYLTSIQSVYNAVFLYRFATQAVTNAVLLTSAPLDNPGMVDISLMPKQAFIYAGSKGREYIDNQGGRHQFPIAARKQDKLDRFNGQLRQLLKKPEYEIFSLIGSGLQLKFGQTTIARQDISRTVPDEKSLGFLALIKDMVTALDPENEFFRIEDTGKDIEIILTIEDGRTKGQLKDFDKGDGVDFLDKQLKLDLAKGPNLICGDTGSDVAMARTAAVRSPDTWAIFVTKDEKLMNEVRSSCRNSLFVPEPDMLVVCLDRLAGLT